MLRGMGGSGQDEAEAGVGRNHVGSRQAATKQAAAKQLPSPNSRF